MQTFLIYQIYFHFPFVCNFFLIIFWMHVWILVLVCARVCVLNRCYGYITAVIITSILVVYVMFEVFGVYMLIYFFLYFRSVSLTGHCYICCFWWYKFRLNASVCMCRLVFGTKVYILEIISNIYPIILQLQWYYKQFSAPHRVVGGSVG